MKTAKLLMTFAVFIGAAAYACAESASTAAAPAGLRAGSPRKRIKPQTAEDVRSLAKELRSSSGDTRSYVMEDIANVPADANQLKPVYLELLDDKDENVQEAAIRGVSKLKLKEAAPKIRAILKSQHRYKLSRKNGIRNLKRVEDLGYTCEAAKALIELDDFESIDEIISRDLFMMNSGGQFLAKFGAKALPKVIQHSKDGEMQYLGARGTISFMRDEAATTQLLELLSGQNAEFAADAAKALSAMVRDIKVGDTKERIAKKLEEQFDHKSAQVRASVYGGLLSVDSGKYGARVFAVLPKEDALTRLNLMYHITQYRIKGLSEFLKQFIKDDEIINPVYHDQRGAAAKALYLTTGEKVQYKGLEEDLKRSYTNPYANN